MNALESIDLSKNLIRTLPSLAFHNLRSLVNLSLARNEISRLDDGVFFGCESLIALNMSRNHIRTIADEWLFGLNALQQLDLSYNHIASFDANAWKQCSELRWLSLHHNQLHFLPSGAFRLLPRLEFLRLSGNSIESFHKTAMTGLDHLNELDLSSNSLAVCLEDNAMLYNTSMPFLKSLKFRNNQLRVIPSRAFERFPALEVLDLADNPITTIHPGAFNPLQLQELYLDTSALLCDCHLAWFSSWFVSSKLSRRTVYTRCAHPIPLSGIDVFAIDSNNLTCGIPPPVIKWSKDGGATFPAALQHRLFVRPADDHLYVVNVTVEDQGVYTCHAVNEAGAIQASATLRIFENSFNVTLKDTVICVNDTLLLDCYADLAHPSQRMEWTFDGEPLFVDGERVSLKAHGQILAVKRVRMSDAGEYACELWAGNDQLARQVSTVTVIGREEIKKDPASQQNFVIRPSAGLLGLISTVVL
ncbi:hypothetical protein GCK32_011203 [Trichostrongylus colubriformis]|uniref:Ig-like domain-containing protein n=1 Tax=Trichostrongylus colubriformis TaxID=6319 RepID=A0AAN8IZ54_TRICO